MAAPGFKTRPLHGDPRPERAPAGAATRTREERTEETRPAALGPVDVAPTTLTTGPFTALLCSATFGIHTLTQSPVTRPTQWGSVGSTGSSRGDRGPRPRRHTTQSNFATRCLNLLKDQQECSHETLLCYSHFMIFLQVHEATVHYHLTIFSKVLEPLKTTSVVRKGSCSRCAIIMESRREESHGGGRRRRRRSGGPTRKGVMT